jgi:leader peptidase (prepilin peptidase) / N-methyltransferase
MTLIWAAIGGVAALPAGTCLRVPVYRMSVRAGEPDQACCQECGALLPARLAIRCAGCGSWFGGPWLIEVLTAAVVALLFGRFGDQPESVVFGFLALTGVALTLVDLAVQRLPDRLTLPAYPVLVASLGLIAIIEHDGAALGRALLGGLALAAGYLLLAVVSGGRLGGGDVKLAGLIGLALGWLGWSSLITGACLGFLLAGIVSLLLLAGRRVTRTTLISFGPYMLGGALFVMVVRS